MYNFNFSIPTEIHFGKDCELSAGPLMRSYGERILMVYGSERIFEDGLGGRLVKSLQDADCTVHLCGGVKPNAEVSFIENAIEAARKESIDGILAVGGGSVIDSAKAISAGWGYEDSVWQLYQNPLAEPKVFLPIGAVVTMPAAASESNDMSVISDDDTGKKLARPFAQVRPKFALLNPELTLTISSFQTASGGFDIFAHAFERYFDLTRGSSLLDGLTESLMRTVIHVLPKVLDAPGDVQLRGELMLAATMAHNDTLGPGGDFACHEISHVITEKYGVAHGAALAMILPAWCSCMWRKAPERFSQFFQRVWATTGNSREEIIIKGIDTMRSFVEQIGLSLSVGKGEASMRELTDAIGLPGGGFAKLSSEEVESILRQFVA